jgi:hypothetical protein
MEGVKVWWWAQIRILKKERKRVFRGLVEELKLKSRKGVRKREDKEWGENRRNH